MASRSWNRVELIGNLTRDPELRYTPNGAAVCTFGIATNRTYVTEGEKKEEVDFHRLVAWNKLAELCNQLLKKGNRTFVSGRLQTRSWEDQSGQTRTVTEIVVEDMILLSPKSGESYAHSEDTESSVKTSETPGDSEQSKPEEKAAENKEPEKEETPKKEDKPAPTAGASSAKEEVDDSDLPF